jgi:hypothetical protein
MCTAQVVRRVRQVALVDEAAVAVAVVAVRGRKEGREVRREKPQLQVLLPLQLVEGEREDFPSLGGQAETGLSLLTRSGLVVEQVVVAQAVVQAAKEFGEAVVGAVESEAPQGQVAEAETGMCALQHSVLEISQ